METKELIELYKDGLRPLAEYLEGYRRSKLTVASKLGEYVRALTTAAGKKYAKTDYKEFLEVMDSVSRTLDRIYGEHPYGPLIVLKEDPELTVKNEVIRLSRFRAMGVREVFYRFDADRLRHKYRQYTSVTDPQAVFLKNLEQVAKTLNEPMGDQTFRTMAGDLFVAVREVQYAGLSKSRETLAPNMVLSFGQDGGLARALMYKKRVEHYQEMVHEMLKYCGVEPKARYDFSMDLQQYNLWLEDEMVNLEELYLCTTYQRILNVL